MVGRSRDAADSFPAQATFRFTRDNNSRYNRSDGTKKKKKNVFLRKSLPCCSVHTNLVAIDFEVVFENGL